ncbi:MAG: hypothetical protein KatS3mg009_3322 [Acidimicrobiia bacterium]|nr:MAG: hypothetical protein KatS3mg009_3322 [Acidimicrobiia bacterium]
MHTAATPAPATNPSSTRRNRSSPAAVTTTNAAMPAIHEIAAPAYPRSAIRPCARVRARMNPPAPAVSSARSRLPRMNFSSPNAILPTKGPIVAAATVPSRPSPTTITTSRRIPDRKSSCRPSPARPASFGSSAACTAWKSRIGTRAMNRPVMNLPGEVLLVGVREDARGEEAAVRERLREHRSEEEQRERARQLRVGRRRAGCHEVALTPERDRHRGEGRERQRESVEAWRTDPGDEEQRAQRDADDALGAVHHPVRPESPVARERAARDVGRVVRGERDEQAREQERLAVEQLVDQARGARQRDQRDRARQQPAEQRGASDERPSADAERAPVRERTAHLLLERLEEAGSDDEHDRPEAVEGGVALVGELAGGQDLEAVRGDARDDEAGADRPRALGERAVLGGRDQPLRAWSHREQVLGRREAEF